MMCECTIADDPREEHFNDNKQYYMSLIKKNTPVMKIIEMAYYEGYDDGWEDCLCDGDDYDYEEEEE